MVLLICFINDLQQVWGKKNKKSNFERASKYW